MKTWIYLILLYNVTFTKGAPIRNKRSGGRVNIAPLIKPPLKLRTGETEHPAPGWGHCIKNIKATDRWRIINMNLKRDQPSQYQCTWNIQSVRYDGNKINKQIQISVQKLTLGTEDESRCQQQFIEIIDRGKSQGRYCGRVKPGDYITIGGTVRIDVQVEASHADKLETKKQMPMIVSYRAISEISPGFRSFTSKLTSSDYDRYHSSTKNVRTSFNDKGYPSPNNDKTSSNTEDAIYPNEALSVGEIVGIVICCSLVIMATVFLVVKRCCCVPDKYDKGDESSEEEEDTPHDESSEGEESHPISYNKAVLLPSTKPLTLSTANDTSLPPNEFIIASEVVSLPKKRNSSSASNKKKLSEMSVVKTNIIEKPTTDKNNKQSNKTSKSKSENITKNGKPLSHRGRSRKKKPTEKCQRNSEKKKRKSSEKNKRSKSENNRSDINNKRKKRHSSEKEKRSKSENNRNKNIENEKRSTSRKVKRSKSESNKQDNTVRKKRTSSKKTQNSKEEEDFIPARRAEKRPEKKSSKKDIANGETKTKSSSHRKKKSSSAADKTDSRLKMRYKRISSTKSKSNQRKKRNSKEKENCKQSDPTPATRYRKKSKKTKSKD